MKQTTQAKYKLYLPVATVAAILLLLAQTIIPYASYADTVTVVETWAARYNGPANSADRANAMAVDGAGNVYVTGYSCSGSTLTTADYATVKYNSAGIQRWAARYNGPANNDDRANAMAVDGAGNVYVTGYSTGSGTGNDYATIKYNSAGTQQWVMRYNGPSNGIDQAAAIAVDGAGNVYVTGYSYNGSTLTSADYATVKYNSAGAEQWVMRYNGPANNEDRALALKVDGAGNVYVTGYSYNGSTLTSADYATVKYNSAGAEQWVMRYNGPGNGGDQATAMAVDGSGNVYVSGYSTGSGTGYDYATIKYNSAGAQQWVMRYNSPANSTDRAYAIAVDGSGNVYVSGYFYNSSTNADYGTVKYNSTGTEQWASRYSGPSTYDDQAKALAIDGAGNVYVSGYSYGSTSIDYATIRYNSSGAQQWVMRYNGPGNSDDYASALAVDGAGNAYVTGYSTGSGTLNDYATIKYTSTTIVSDSDTVTITGTVQAVIDVTAPADFNMSLIPGATCTSAAQSVTVKCNKAGWTLAVSDEKSTDKGHMVNGGTPLENAFSVAGGDLSGYQPLTSPRYLENGSSGATVGITTISSITFQQYADWNDSPADYTIVITFTGSTN